MNKRDARKLALSRNFAAGELIDLINKAKDSYIGQMSKVNPGIPLYKALEVYAAAIPRDRESVMDPSMRGNALIITNILRDCA